MTPKQAKTLIAMLAQPINSLTGDQLQAVWALISFSGEESLQPENKYDLVLEAASGNCTANNADHRVRAIKSIREITGYGLREAMEIVDDVSIREVATLILWDQSFDRVNEAMAKLSPFFQLRISMLTTVKST